MLLGAAVLLPLLAAAALSVVRDQVSGTNDVLVLVLVVVAVASGGSRLAGMLAAASAVAWFDYFLVEPYHRFVIDGREDVETAVLLSLVGLAVTEVVLWGRRHQARSSRRAGYVQGLVDAATMAASGGTSPAETLAFVGRQIEQVLGVDRCEYVAGPPLARPRLDQDGCVRLHGKLLDVERSGLPTLDVVELPVSRGGVVLGRFVLTTTSRVLWPTLEQRLVAVTLADQVAAVLHLGEADQTLGRDLR